MTGNQILKKRDALAVIRAPRMAHWDEIAPFFTQYQSVYANGCDDITPGMWQFDSVPMQANHTLANGLAASVVPRSEEFAEFTPPTALKNDDDAVRWTRQCSEIHQTYLQNSNLWEELQDALTELGPFGNMCLFVGGYDEKRDELFFKHVPIGTYYFAEDARGIVNTLYRELMYTADEAAGEYGEDKLPEEIREKVGKAEGSTTKFKFVHAVEPRKTSGKKGRRPKNDKPFASYVVYDGGKKDIVQEDGFDSFPFAVGRWKRDRNNPYGWGPATVVLGEARQLNKLNELADVGTEISVFPPVVAHPGMEGAIDMGSLGINYLDPSDTSAFGVRQLSTNNRLDQCDLRMQQKEQKINNAFHVPLFTLFSQRALDKAPLTATESRLIEAEKISQFSPIYGRLISEVLDIIMRRGFESLLAAVKFPEAPLSMMDVDAKGQVVGLAEPSILYKNRISLALQARRNNAVAPVLGMLQAVLTTNPEMAPVIYAGFEIPRLVRDTARNEGWPEEWLATDTVMKERVQDITAAQEQARQAQMLEAGSKTAANLGKAPPELVAGATSVLG